eukprot:4079338-Alexandrium_andersonii.AAC.1
MAPSALESPPPLSCVHLAPHAMCKTPGTCNLSRGYPSSKMSMPCVYISAGKLIESLGITHFSKSSG